MGFFQNTCKPEGLGGKIMVTTMNIGGHAALAKWRLYHARLYREQTLAGGGTVCDYWFVGDQEQKQV